MLSTPETVLLKLALTDSCMRETVKYSEIEKASVKIINKQLNHLFNKD